jgi:hypothetical protein
LLALCLLGRSGLLHGLGLALRLLLFGLLLFDVRGAQHLTAA